MCFDASPFYPPSPISELKSVMVCNKSFGVLAVKYKFHKFPKKKLPRELNLFHVSTHKLNHIGSHLFLPILKSIFHLISCGWLEMGDHYIHYWKQVIATYLATQTNSNLLFVHSQFSHTNQLKLYRNLLKIHQLFHSSALQSSIHNITIAQIGFGKQFILAPRKRCNSNHPRIWQTSMFPDPYF